MTFLDRLKANIGGLVRIKNQLYWYNSCDWDKTPGRICLLLDVANYGLAQATAAPAGTGGGLGPANAALAQLMIDGQSCWVWLTDEYIDLIPCGDQ